MFGFYAGPDKHIVDINTLADPLLARLPIPADRAFRIGHYERDVPAGYLESLAAGANLICDPGIRELYGQIALVTRGPIWSRERWAAIWSLNSGGASRFARTAVETPGDALCNAQMRTGVKFGDALELRGFSVSSEQVRPGETLLVTLYWVGDPTPGRDLMSFVHIRDAPAGTQKEPRSGRDMWAQTDQLEPGGELTSEYVPGRVYPDLLYVALPRDIPPGDYMVEVGLYDQKNNEQLDPVAETVKLPLRVNWRSVLLPPVRVVP